MKYSTWNKYYTDSKSMWSSTRGQGHNMWLLVKKNKKNMYNKNIVIKTNGCRKGRLNSNHYNETNLMKQLRARTRNNYPPPRT